MANSTLEMEHIEFLDGDGKTLREEGVSRLWISIPNPGLFLLLPRGAECLLLAGRPGAPESRPGPRLSSPPASVGAPGGGTGTTPSGSRSGSRSTWPASPGTEMHRVTGAARGTWTRPSPRGWQGWEVYRADMLWDLG